MVADHYPQFIEEAFIEPIRSVLIVDDDYPTYDEVLHAGGGAGAPENSPARKTWHHQRERVRSVISVFRRRQPPLIVDIHDGTNVATKRELAAATHLHQCDLLVLDYELDRDKPRNGTRAIEIIRALMANHHFNLVVIYTNLDLDVAFDAIRWGLVAPSTDVLSDTDIDNAMTLIDEGEDTFLNFSRHVAESVAAEQYFHARMNQSSYLGTMARAQQPYALFTSLADRVNWSGGQRKLVLRYLLKQVESSNELSSASTHRFVDLEWSYRGSRWIKSSSAFVALSKKTDNGDDLLGDLRKALAHWSPRPSRLFLTKMRAEMDEYGVAAQAPVLSNHYALAYWYYDLLTADGKEDRRWRISESLSRHAGQLMQEMLPRVEEYATRLIDSEIASGDSKVICKNHFGVNLNNNRDGDKAVLEHNIFVCSMDPSGSHLVTGHIFSMNDEPWLCLSPACDMVPSQVPNWRTAMIGERLPFIAIRLRPARATKALEEVHSNRFIFLRIEGEVKCYCFNDPSVEASAPHWQVLYAEKRGRFSGTDFRFTVSYIKQGKTRLVSERKKAQVVAQLRYEYALNLIQKLGVSLTRVGLDFSKWMESVT